MTNLYNILCDSTIDSGHRRKCLSISAQLSEGRECCVSSMIVYRKSVGAGTVRVGNISERGGRDKCHTSYTLGCCKMLHGQ